MAVLFSTIYQLLASYLAHASYSRNIYGIAPTHHTKFFAVNEYLYYTGNVKSKRTFWRFFANTKIN